MLPIPNLDDRLFEEMMRDARNLIPKTLPQWTDENAHDPGITFLELFSWLSEMQQYYLNRVPAKNEWKFLHLMGLERQLAASARTDVLFSGEISEVLPVPRGTRLYGAGLPFETEESFWLLPLRIGSVLVHTASETLDVTTFNENNKLAYYAFGPEAKQGSRLVIGLEGEKSVAQPLQVTLSFKVFEDYPVPVPPLQTGHGDVVPSVKLAWSYQDIDSASGRILQKPLTVIEDETVQFTRSGRITLELPAGTLQTEIDHRVGYWISCTVEEGGYELPPRIERIGLNTMTIVQRETWSEVVTFDGTGDVLRCDTDLYLAQFGQVNVQVRVGDGWRDLGATAYGLVRDPDTLQTALHFGHEYGLIPQQGTGNIRLIAHAAEFADKRYLGRSTGLPHQRFELPVHPVLAESLSLQVAVPDLKQGVIWQDWTRVDDFEHSAPDDRHFMIDWDTGEIVFGDNQRGEIPESVEGENIRLLSLQTGGGTQGNVIKNLALTLTGEHDYHPEFAGFHGLRAQTLFFATGGREHETLSQAKLRARREFKKQHRAVTEDDYEEIVRGTPGLRIARAKAIPLFRVGMNDYPREKAPTEVTVVVVPYSPLYPPPQPSKGFLETVRRHLEPHRLLTTEVHVAGPEYVEITVHAEVVVASDGKDYSAAIIEELRRFLRPYDPEAPTKGWEFGGTVYHGDIYGVISRMPGVEYVQDLWLSANGRGCVKDANGDVNLPPHGLIYSGTHEIVTKSRTNW